MIETTTAAAVGAPTAATAGTTSTITLGVPFGTTAQQYRGMPLLLSGDRAVTTGVAPPPPAPPSLVCARAWLAVGYVPRSHVAARSWTWPPERPR